MRAVADNGELCDLLRRKGKFRRSDIRVELDRIIRVFHKILERLFKVRIVVRTVECQRTRILRADLPVISVCVERVIGGILVVYPEMICEIRCTACGEDGYSGRELGKGVGSLIIHLDLK